MIKKIRITICKEDIYFCQDLIDEIKEDPKGAFDLCEIYGYDDLPFELFADFDSLPQEDKDKLIEALASSKSEADADLTEEQDEKFEAFLEVFEEES